MSTSASETANSSRENIRLKLTEWGPIDKDVFILRMTPLMPAGYAWRRWVIDTKLRHKVDALDDMPEPTLDDFEKAQRALVLWHLRQLRREGWLYEQGVKLSLRKHRRRKE